MLACWRSYVLIGGSAVAHGAGAIRFPPEAWLHSEFNCRRAENLRAGSAAPWLTQRLNIGRKVDLLKYSHTAGPGPALCMPTYSPPLNATKLLW